MRRTQTTHPHPAQLESTRRRFERWRATREGRACIPQPSRHGGEDFGLRWPGILVVPQAFVQQSVPLVAHQSDRSGQGGGGPPVAGPALGGQSRRNPGGAGVEAGQPRGVNGFSKTKRRFTAYVPVLR